MGHFIRKRVDSPRIGYAITNDSNLISSRRYQFEKLESTPTMA
ncbi:hypothetical protein [Duncaniella dubosii]